MEPPSPSRSPPSPSAGVIADSETSDKPPPWEALQVPSAAMPLTVNITMLGWPDTSMLQPSEPTVSEPTLSPSTIASICVPAGAAEPSSITSYP